MSQNIIDGLIFLMLIGLLLTVTHISAVIIDLSNKKNAKSKSLEGENQDVNP